jgi:penicillin-binding protein 2
VAFAPAEDPKIVVSVLIEHGGHGGSAAAPIAKKVIEAFYNR